MRLFSDTSFAMEQKQIELIRKASISQRVALARSLSATDMSLSRRAIKRANPGLSDREIDILFISHHYGKELADSVKKYLELRDKENGIILQ